MTNKFTFTVTIRCGKRTEPQVGVEYYGNENQMQIGPGIFTKQGIAEWIEGILGNGIKQVRNKM